MADLTTDVLVVGGGPAGSTAALELLARGVKPLVLEREVFPRYHIGESMTGECGALVRSLGLGEAMAAAGFPVKHGVRVFGTSGRPDWWLPVMRRTTDLELHEQFTWQVRRSDFDDLLLGAAGERGAEVVHGRATEPLVDERTGRVEGVRAVLGDGRERTIRAGLTIDCSGQATFFANRGVTGPKYLGAYDKQIAVFSQVAGYRRDDGPDRVGAPGNTHIFYRSKYRWAWAIPLTDELTSVGVVVPAKHFRERGETRADFLARELTELNPGLSERVGEPRLVEDTRVIPNYSFQVDRFAGPGYVCVGDSHRFVDPIFSFGLYIAIKEATLAASLVADRLGGATSGSSPFAEHVVGCEKAIDVLEDVIDTFWENPLAFSVFAHGRYRGPMIDVFAGRIYEGMPTSGLDDALTAFRRLLGRTRSYGPDDPVSVPVGSRFDPSRAELWNAALDSVETTEAWMRDQ